MNKRIRYCLLFYSFMIILASCVEPYQPSAITGEVHILVVDGFINRTGVGIVGYTTARSDCIDCRSQGGTRTNLISGNLTVL